MMTGGTPYFQRNPFLWNTTQRHVFLRSFSLAETKFSKLELDPSKKASANFSHTGSSCSLESLELGENIWGTGGNMGKHGKTIQCFIIGLVFKETDHRKPHISWEKTMVSGSDLIFSAPGFHFQLTQLLFNWIPTIRTRENQARCTQCDQRPHRNCQGQRFLRSTKAESKNSWAQPQWCPVQKKVSMLWNKYQQIHMFPFNLLQHRFFQWLKHQATDINRPTNTYALHQTTHIQVAKFHTTFSWHMSSVSCGGGVSVGLRVGTFGKAAWSRCLLSSPDIHGNKKAALTNRRINAIWSWGAFHGDGATSLILPICWMVYFRENITI